MKHLAQVAFAVSITAAALGGCGGSTSSTPSTPQTVTTPSPSPAAPTPLPSPGPVTLAYTSSFGATSAATAAPPTLTFPAPTLSATLTASQANYAGAFSAASNCGPVNVTTLPSAVATQFTLNAADATRTTSCTITVTGGAGLTATLNATVAAPAGVVLRWYTPQAVVSNVPIPQTAGPIDLVGLGSNYQAYLAISEQNYVQGFPAATTVNCAPNVTVTADATTPTGLPTPSPATPTSASSLAYYTVLAPTSDVLPLAATCVITAQDSYVPTSPASTPTNSPQSISVQVTGNSGTVQ